jgi:hypothetical protein
MLLPGKTQNLAFILSTQVTLQNHIKKSKFSGFFFFLIAETDSNKSL